jgi:PAS domain-containing protein
VPSKLHIPDSQIAKWQRIADLLAQSAGVPAALIMRVDPPEIEVFISSESADNPYKQSERAQLNSGLYCEKVMATREPLLVPDARKDPDWDHNPDIKLGMVCYLGFPLIWPNGKIFGTLCILDRKDNPKATANHELLELLKGVVEGDLKALFDAECQKQMGESQLREAKEKYQALVESTSDWIWEVDQHAIYTYSSPNVRNILGYEPEEIVGKTPFDLMPPRETKHVADEFKTIVEAKKSFNGLVNSNLH